MITVANSVTINRPLDEVFSYVGDPSNGPHWMFDCTGYIPVSDGEIGAGTRFKWVLKFMGGREVEAEVRNHQPSTAQEIQVLSGAPDSAAKWMSNPPVHFASWRRCCAA